MWLKNEILYSTSTKMQISAKLARDDLLLLI